MRRRISLAALACLVLLAATAGMLLGAEPSLVPEPLIGGDPRSEGSGPGIVGSPIVVLGAVVALGLATALVTVLIARLARRS